MTLSGRHQLITQSIQQAVTHTKPTNLLTKASIKIMWSLITPR